MLAGINYYEFKYREADFGSYPKGLMYGLQIMDSWLYDETKPFLHIEALDTFGELKRTRDLVYFEALTDKYLLRNPHTSVVILKPHKGLAAIQEEENKKKLEDILEKMTPEERAQVKDRQELLLQFQETPDSPEDLQKIPLLTRKDLKKEANALVNEERPLGDTRLLYHPVFTNGIGYLRLIFFVKDIPREYFPYIGVLKGCLGLLNTEHYQYGDLFNEMNLVTGGMAAVNNVYANVEDSDRFSVTLELKTKALYENLGKAVELMQEILFTSDFSDTKRLYEILAEGKSRMQAQMISAGHSVAEHAI